MAMTLEEARAAMERAATLYTNRQWQEAADAFTELLLEPEALEGANELHWNTAMCFAHLGNLELAEQHVSAGGYSSDEFHRQFARSAYELAAALYNEQRWSEAADAFVELVLLPGVEASAMGEIHWNVAMCFARLGNWDLALQHVSAGGYTEEEFRRAAAEGGITGADSGADARQRLADAAALYQNQQWSEAADAFTDLLLMPGLPADGMGEVHWNIGMCFAHLDNWELAFSHVRAGGGDEAEFRRTCTDAGLAPPEQ
jgi:tetratricopeptide (TPR) repeat protein